MKLRFLTLALLSIGLSVSISSCVDLEEDVERTGFTLDNYFTEPSHAEAGLVGIYSSLRGTFGTSHLLMSTEGGIPIAANRLDNYGFDATNQYFYRQWFDCYRTIYNTNVYLVGVKDLDMDEDLKMQFMGEARFLRALAYFNLVRYFGGVPLVTETSSTYEEALIPNGATDNKNAQIEEVYNLIIEDLTFAEQHVLHSPYSGLAEGAHPETDIARVSVGAVKGILAKVYLTMAGYPLQKGASHYELARDYAKEVIDLGYYRLLDDYSQLFTPTNENSEEVLFSVQYGPEAGEGQAWGGWQNAKKPRNGYGRFLMSPNFVVKDTTSGALDYENTYYHPEDPRRIYTVVDWKEDGSVYHNRINGDIGKLETWKFRYAVLPISFNVTEINCVVLRYADVLLMYAEALNELNGGPTQEAVDYVNMVRARARGGMPAITVPGNTPYNPSNVEDCPIIIPEPATIAASDYPMDVEAGLSYEEFKELIVYDRVKELIMEGHDRFDLIRQGPEDFMMYVKRSRKRGSQQKENNVAYDENCELVQTGGKTVVSSTLNYTALTDAARNVREHHLFYPVPQIAMDANRALEQNPGY